MDFFRKAKSVRLRSHHDKYLVADEDQEGVSQDRNGTTKKAKWTVEILDAANAIRLKSCYGKYLTASNVPFLFGMRGMKVLQTVPTRLDSSVEWEPIREGVQVKLKTRYGQYLRANGGVPPWRNHITHDVPHKVGPRDWVLWDVDMIEMRKEKDAPSPPVNSLRWPSTGEVVSQRRQDQPQLPSPEPVNAFADEDDSKLDSPVSMRFHSHIPSLSNDSSVGPSIKIEGRVIAYTVANENGDVDEGQELSFTFKGSGVEELKQKLEEETRLNDILVCSRNPLNGKLYPLRLQLPPTNTNIHVVVVPSSGKAASNVIQPGSPAAT